MRTLFFKFYITGKRTQAKRWSKIPLDSDVGVRGYLFMRTGNMEETIPRSRIPTDILLGRLGIGIIGYTYT